jgi:peptide/nickel transport system substrate-binding protein
MAGTATTTAGTTKATSKATATTARRAATTKVTAPAPIAQVVATPTSAPSGEKPQPGGTITYLMFVEGQSLDPAKLANPITSGTQDGMRIFPIFDVLLYQETNGNLHPQVAQSMTSSDGTTWTIKLRPNVKFTDGTMYDATAIKFNWDRYADPSVKSPLASVVGAIASTQVTDPLTLQVTLKSANGQFPRTVARNLSAIGSPAAIQAKGDGFSNAPVGAGPFVLKEWVRDSQLTLVRNPNYWNSPLPYVDQVVYRIVPDAQQRNNSFNASEGNVLWQTNIPQIADELKTNSANIKTILSGGRDLVFNVTRPPFNDVRARRAVAMAIDYAQYMQTVELGIGARADTIPAPDSPFYDSSITMPNTDKAGAQQLLDQLKADTGKDLEFSITTAASSQSTVDFMQSQLNQQYKNIKVTTQTLSPTQVSTNLLSKNFDVTTFGITFADPEPNLYNNFFSTGPSNFGGYKNSDVDQAFNTARSSLDQSARVNAYKTVQRALAADQPVIWTTRVQFVTFFKPEIKDLTLFEDGVPLVDRVWLKK